ncbi:hypothetical protein BGZ60DRAFT_517277 [Tricladium varicosporioides]|nr:hypothetical protein BGZ60DRAFT_517277 [Hymenoscyphus varicosporioides]
MLLPLSLTGLGSTLSLLPTLAIAATCDRKCLESVMSTYLVAITSHSPNSLPVTSNVKYVENAQNIPLNQGAEWAISGAIPGKYRHDISDPSSGQVATITTITENGIGAIYLVRLKVEADGKISEIETAITRDPTGAMRYEKMGVPEPIWLEPVPIAQRIPRSKLISQTDKYYLGMERNDPKGNYSFFDKNCTRIEDGLQTTNVQTGDPYGHSNDTLFASLTCEQQFQSGFLGFVTNIREKQFTVVDEERQAIYVVSTLDHNGTVRSLPDGNGTSPIPPYFDVPRTLQAVEAFRLKGDKLLRIEMTLTEIPYGMRSAFPSDPPTNLSGPGTKFIVPIPCNRTCLEVTTEKVLQAMLAHNFSALPLSPKVQYSENGQFLALGNGLWLTLSQFASQSNSSEYAAFFADPDSGTGAYWGQTQEHSIAGVLSLRVKVSAGKITEIEAVDVRAENNGARFGTKTLMRPPLPVEWDGLADLGNLSSLLEKTESGNTIPSNLVKAYFDGLETHNSANVPFSTTCTRRDNFAQANFTCGAQMSGLGVAPNGLPSSTTIVRDRRILIEDSEKGVVLAVAMVDNPAVANGAAALSETERLPGTYMVSQMISIQNRKIERVEGMLKYMPFGYTSVWGEEKGDE